MMSWETWHGFFDRENELARKLKGEAAKLVQKIKMAMINVSRVGKQAVPFALAGEWTRLNHTKLLVWLTQLQVHTIW